MNKLADGEKGDNYQKFLVNGRINRLVVDTDIFAEGFHRLFWFSLEDEPSDGLRNQPPCGHNSTNECQCDGGEETPIPQGVCDPRKAAGAHSHRNMSTFNSGQYCLSEKETHLSSIRGQYCLRNRTYKSYGESWNYCSHMWDKKVWIKSGRFTVMK
jgi:hypothetical protein